MTKIKAYYGTYTDKYIAVIRSKMGETIIEKKNGNDLVSAIKAETGVEISYNWNTRGFDVPEENILD